MSRFTLSYRTALIAAALIAFTAHALPAQTPTAENSSQSESPLRRFSFGGRLTVLGTNSMKSGSMMTVTSDPAVTVTADTSSSSKRVGGGIAFELAITGRLSLGADLLYKRAGYHRTVTRVEGVDDTSTTTVESTTTQEKEDTRADYWDLPILARYYTKGRSEGGFRSFFLGGAAFRRVSGIHTVREAVRADGLSDTYTAPATAANRTIGGVVLGVGFQVNDEIGFKFMPEVRYTRWLRPTFDNDPTVSPKNQVEVVLGFTF